MKDCPTCHGYGLVEDEEDRRLDEEFEARCAPYGFIGPLAEPQPACKYFPEISVSRGEIKWTLS